MDPNFFYPPPSTRNGERGLRRDFLNNLKSYRGKGPELVNRGVVVDSGTRLRILRAAMVGDDVVDDSETTIFINGELPFYRY